LHFLEPDGAFHLLDSEGRLIAHQEVARRPMKIQWDPQRLHFHCEGRVYPALVVSPTGGAESDGRWRRWQGEEVEVLFPAALPAGGYTTVRVVAGPAPAAPGATDLQAGATWLENARVRVDVAADGSFALTDKESGRRYGPLNVFRSEADRGDEYSFCPAVGAPPVSSRDGQARVTLVEDGPLRATLEVRLALAAPAGLAEDRSHGVAEKVTIPICTRLSLGPGRRRVEIQTEVENTARDHRLRALFSSGVQTDVADAQGQFQVMRRPAALPDEERARVPEFDEEQEVSYHPQRAFVDVSDAAGGLAILNRGLPEYEAEPEESGVCLGLTLLRCVGWLSRDDLSTRYKHAGPPLETPEAQCLGRHTFEYAVVPHSGDWLTGGVAVEAERYVTPVHAAPLAPGEPVAAILPGEAGLYELGPAELIFSACKRSEAGDRILLRAYNIAPYALDGTLRLGVPGRVRLANLAERELSPPLAPEPGGAPDSRLYRFRVQPHEIITLSLQRDEAQSAE
jgi:mannosylglycerate hydrolase